MNEVCLFSSLWVWCWDPSLKRFHSTWSWSNSFMEHIGVFMDGSCLIQDLWVLLLFWKLDLESAVKSYLSLQPRPGEFLWPAESCGYYCKGLSATWRSYKTKHISRVAPSFEPSIISKDNQVPKDFPEDQRGPYKIYLQ